ncbi:MAG: hypothetical protein AAFV45_05880 [Pseudomonadota bacterium]
MSALGIKRPAFISYFDVGSKTNPQTYKSRVVGFFRRLGNALIESRMRSAELQIARVLARTRDDDLLKAGWDQSDIARLRSLSGQS